MSEDVSLAKLLPSTISHLEWPDNGASQPDLFMYICGKEISLPLFYMSVWPFVCYLTQIVDEELAIMAVIKRFYMSALIGVTERRLAGRSERLAE